MRYEVWHATAPTWMDASDAALAKFPEGYVHVADVGTPFYQEAYELTNHIEAPWPTNPEVLMAQGFERSKGVRSTSVGDVIVEATAYRADAEGRPMWRRWAVQAIGFRPF